MSREDIINGLRERAAQMAAKYGITPEDAFIQAYELWCFLADRNLIGTELTFEYVMRGPASAAFIVKPGQPPTGYPYYIQYAF